MTADPHRAVVRAGTAIGIGMGGLDLTAGLAWLAVGLPILWGVWITLSKAFVLFR